MEKEKTEYHEKIYNSHRSLINFSREKSLDPLDLNYENHLLHTIVADFLIRKGFDPSPVNQFFEKISPPEVVIDEYDHHILNYVYPLSFDSLTEIIQSMVPWDIISREWKRLTGNKNDCLYGYLSGEERKFVISLMIGIVCFSGENRERLTENDLSERFLNIVYQWHWGDDHKFFYKKVCSEMIELLKEKRYIPCWLKIFKKFTTHFPVFCIKENVPEWREIRLIHSLSENPPLLSAERNEYTAIKGRLVWCKYIDNVSPLNFSLRLDDYLQLLLLDEKNLIVWDISLRSTGGAHKKFLANRNHFLSNKYLELEVKPLGKPYYNSIFELWCQPCYSPEIFLGVKHGS
jgi:hypothetical protein